MEWLYHYLPASFFTIAALWFLSVILFSGIINTGSVVGTVSCTLLAAAFWNFDRTLQTITGLWQTAGGKITLGAGFFLSLFFALLAMLFSVFMLAAAGHMAPVGTEYPLVVLGCKVNGDQPSRMLRHRLEAAEEYLKTCPDAVCVVSGGQGDNETSTEGAVMKKWLMEHGIAEERIFSEERSANTEQNLRYSREVLQNAGISAEHIVIATDSYHQLRAKLFAQKQGMDVFACSARTEIHLLPTYWVREWFGLCKYFVFQSR